MHPRHPLPRTARVPFLMLTTLLSGLSWPGSAFAASFFGTCPSGQMAFFDVSPKVHDAWTKLCVTDQGFAKQVSCDGRNSQKIAIFRLAPPLESHNVLISIDSSQPLHGTREGEWHVRRAGQADTFSEYEGNAAQHYELIVVDGAQDPKDRSYMIANLKTKGGYKEIWDAGGNWDWAHVRHYPGNSVDPRRKFYFRDLTTVCVPESNFGPGPIPPNDIGDVERLTGPGHVPAAKTQPVNLGVAPFPAFLTRASNRAPADVYYLVREGYWTQAFFFDHGGASDWTESQTARIGITNATSTEVTANTGISVTRSKEFSFKGLSKTVSSEVSRSLQVSVSNSTEAMASKECTVSRTYHAKDRVIDALWYRADRYSVVREHDHRPDSHPESVVFSWEVVDPSIKITDAWRPEGSQSRASADAEAFTSDCSL